MEKFDNITAPKPEVIQNIRAEDFWKNSEIILTAAGHSWDFSRTRKKYYLVHFDDTEIIFMIDANNLYIDGFMWKTEKDYSCYCCTGAEVIAHSYEKQKKINIKSISKICGSLKELENNPSGKYQEIEDNLDTIAFLVSESIRFDAIHEYLAQKSAINVPVINFKDLVTSWGQCQYSQKLHIPKGETKKY
ncbi:MAG: hypothetical protein IJ530_10645 [Treponema sp.]|uniref:hypothetical protein n=1 Tax=Treponema sp. TaxID=166 RepID=UPI0025F2BCD7|nr:hypothetical protein [Treponema sp.]MBQ8680205.1 hypothetical protein [Treponema sp.]